jgi:hypothetical protein
MSQLYRQTCINGHPATLGPDNGKPWCCGDPECEYFDGANDTLRIGRTVGLTFFS